MALKMKSSEVTSAKSEIFNPLALPSMAVTASDGQQDVQVSLSLTNTKIGVCPKCTKPMTQAIASNDDTVFYCLADRVAMPMPNNAL